MTAPGDVPTRLLEAKGLLNPEGGGRVELRVAAVALLTFNALIAFLVRRDRLARDGACALRAADFVTTL